MRLPVPAVVFDVDGVLVRSIENHCLSYRAVFAARGVDMDARDMYLSEGKATLEVAGLLCAKYSLPTDAESIAQVLREKKAAFYALPLPELYPGAAELVASLQASGVKVGFASGSSRELLRRLLGDLHDRFDASISADDVERTKPDPEPYLKAFARLGVPAHQGIVVENAPLGIRAAKAAGARVIAITSTLPEADLAEEKPDVIVPDLATAVAILYED